MGRVCRLFLYLFVYLLALLRARPPSHYPLRVAQSYFAHWPAACVEASMEILISRHPILNGWARVPFSIWINVYFAGVECPAYKKGGKKAAEEDRVTPSIWATVIFYLNTPSRCCTFCSSPIGSCICWPHRRLVNWHDAPFFCRGTMVL